MISHKHKTIFVHIPKVAGQSIEWLYLEDLGLNWETRGELLLRPKRKNEKGPYRLAHLRAKDYVDLGYVDDRTFNEYFTFGFVRNPYRRVFSLYRFLGYSRIMKLEDFIDNVLQAKLREDDFFFRSQVDYLCDSNGRIIVDFIGRLEQIETDIQTVMQRSGLKGELKHANKSKGEWNRAVSLLIRNPAFITTLRFHENKKSFEQSFNETIKRKICNLYAADFELLGYKTDIE